MVSDAKNLFLAGVGAAALTYEKATEVVNQLVQRGKITVEEGRELSEELKIDMKKTVNDTKDSMVNAVNNIKPLTLEDLKSVLSEMNYVTKADIMQLQRAIERLGEKIK